jgi:hypothetical protein
MGVGFYKARQRDAAATIERGRARWRRAACNAPRQNQDIREITSKGANVADKQISRHPLFLNRAGLGAPWAHLPVK